jgi:crossover junction endodeoxyribonuclease RuvC
MIWIGIDPGQKGGYALIIAKEEKIDNGVYVYPWDDNEFPAKMRGIKHLADNPVMVACVEKVGAMHGQGVRSMFTFGQSYGFILGVLAALGIGVQLVPPGTWKK